MPKPPVPKPANQTPPLSHPASPPVALGRLLALLHPVPEEWLRAQSGASGAGNAVEGGNPHQLECTPCSSYKELVLAWRKALQWTSGLDRALSTMLASSLSTMSVGEQLWIKIIGPPSCGKTTLMEGLALSHYFVSKDTIRGFHTGWRDSDGNDCSLAALCKGMTLGVKDADGILRAPNRDQILAEGRGLYDKVSRTHYRNNVANDYSGHRMTMLWCGTSSLREIDDSELGARMLDCVVMDGIDDDFEDEVGLRAANQEMRNMAKQSDDTAASQHPEELVVAMSLTGGYLNYLRDNAAELYSNVLTDQSVLKRSNRYGKFVSYMRARPSRKHDEEADREFSARLTKQLTRLAISTAVVMNREEVDDAVMLRVHQVAMDTSRGVTLNIARLLYKYPEGLAHRTIALNLGRTVDKTGIVLRFLREIGVLQHVTERKHGVTKQPRWQLTQRVRKLYGDVVGDR